jgi:SAM-dependent methyltransferase
VTSPPTLLRDGRQDSFRDPAGYLLRHDSRLFRIVTDARAAEELRAALALPFLRDTIARGSLVSSSETQSLPAPMPDVERAALMLEHEVVPFVSYPYEWPPEMLFEAGRLTLELALGVLEAGFGLKDATPYNVLFRGARPVFVDVLSLERRDPTDCLWLPYAQFQRLFVLPLLAHRAAGLGLASLLLTRRDGVEPQEVYRLLGPVERLRPPFLGNVSLPTWLSGSGGKAASSYRKAAGSAEEGRFVLQTLLRGLQRAMKRSAPRGRKSEWSGYTDSNDPISLQQRAEKQAFVTSFLEEHRPAAVLDVGCNTGDMSLLAARHGARVVAIDRDEAVIGRLWHRAHEEKADVLPLVVDITRPSPGIGWRNRECSSFLERARGGFDGVLMLAVLHHMLVTEGIPLTEALGLAAEMTRDLLLIELVAPQDPMFRLICRGREALYEYLDRPLFERECARRFDTLAFRPLAGGTRWLYVLRRKRVP